MTDVEKLVKQLRSAAKLEAYYNSEYNGLYNQAADALEELQAENEKLRDGLKQAIENNSKLCETIMTIRKSERRWTA